jgi:hypothetical protein
MLPGSYLILFGHIWMLASAICSYLLPKNQPLCFRSHMAQPLGGTQNFEGGVWPLRALSATYNPLIATCNLLEPTSNLLISAQSRVPGAVSLSKCGQYSSRRPQKAPGGPRNSQESPRGPRRPQEPPEGLELGTNVGCQRGILYTPSHLRSPIMDAFNNRRWL